MPSTYNQTYYQHYKNNSLIYKLFIGLVNRKEPVFRYLKTQKTKGSKLLDLGCGSGNFLRFAQNYFDCTGIDNSQDGINLAKKQAPKVTYICNSVENLKLLKDRFEVITCFDLLEHLENHQPIIRQIARLLNYNGLLALSVPNTASLGKKLKGKNWYGYRDKTHVSLFDSQAWQKIFANEGFILLKQYYNGLIDPPYIKYVPSFLQIIGFKYLTQALSLIGFSLPKTSGEIVFMVFKKV